jgi:RNA polymerase sigma-70 factor (ECF subfamily)
MAINVEEFYRKYGPMVLRRCRAILKDEEKAMDAMQETFIRILKAQDRLDDKGPSSLLYTTATNVCLNVIRSEKRKPETSSDEVLLQIAGLDDPEGTALTGHFLDRLFEDEKASTRVMATLHYVDGYTLEETASAVNMSVSGVRKRLRNLRSRGLELKET